MASRVLGSWRRSSFAAGLILIAGVTGAVAQQRCEGTLCDLYYDHLAQPQSKPTTAPQSSPPPAAAQQGDSLLGKLFGGGTPQPSSAAPPAKKPIVAVQGGGLIGLMHGDAPQRCTGTLCDLFYGGPPPETPATRAAVPAESRDAADDAPAPEPASRAVTPRDAAPSCTARPGDPWGCYR